MARGLEIRGIDIRVSTGIGGLVEFRDGSGGDLPLRVSCDTHDATVEPTEPGVSACRTRSRADVTGLCDDAERVIRALRPSAPGVGAASR
jgi:hypothetical protein